LIISIIGAAASCVLCLNSPKPLIKLACLDRLTKASTIFDNSAASAGVISPAATSDALGGLAGGSKLRICAKFTASLVKWVCASGACPRSRVSFFLAISLPAGSGEGIMTASRN